MTYALMIQDRAGRYYSVAWIEENGRVWFVTTFNGLGPSEDVYFSDPTLTPVGTGL